MSRVGISNNVTQPDARCMSCKRWKSASKRGFFDLRNTGIVLFRIVREMQEIKEREENKWLI